MCMTIVISYTESARLKVCDSADGWINARGAARDGRASSVVQQLAWRRWLGRRAHQAAAPTGAPRVLAAGRRGEGARRPRPLQHARDAATAAELRLEQEARRAAKWAEVQPAIGLAHEFWAPTRPYQPTNMAHARRRRPGSSPARVRAAAAQAQRRSCGTRGPASSGLVRSRQIHIPGLLRGSRRPHPRPKDQERSASTSEKNI